MNTEKIAISKIQFNKGQIKGVPTNPRTWGQSELDTLAQSMEETPELTEARGLIVYEQKGKYVTLGGNMRLAAAKQLGWKEITCTILPADTTTETMKQIVAKDNSQFGDWDMEMLTSEWGDIDLGQWGVKDFWPTRPKEVEQVEQVETPQPTKCESDTNRIIITYPKDMEGKLAELLGVEKIEKTTFNVEEL